MSFPARYPGRCAKCASQIVQGQLITDAGSPGNFHHEECPPRSERRVALPVMGVPIIALDEVGEQALDVMRTNLASVPLNQDRQRRARLRWSKDPDKDRHPYSEHPYFKNREWEFREWNEGDDLYWADPQ